LIVIEVQSFLYAYEFTVLGLEWTRFIWQRYDESTSVWTRCLLWTIRTSREYIK